MKAARHGVYYCEIEAGQFYLLHDRGTVEKLLMTRHGGG